MYIMRQNPSVRNSRLSGSAQEIWQAAKKVSQPHPHGASQQAGNRQQGQAARQAAARHASPGIRGISSPGHRVESVERIDQLGCKNVGNWRIGPCGAPGALEWVELRSGRRRRGRKGFLRSQRLGDGQLCPAKGAGHALGVGGRLHRRAAGLAGKGKGHAGIIK